MYSLLYAATKMSFQLIYWLCNDSTGISLNVLIQLSIPVFADGYCVCVFSMLQQEVHDSSLTFSSCLHTASKSVWSPRSWLCQIFLNMYRASPKHWVQPSRFPGMCQSYSMPLMDISFLFNVLVSFLLAPLIIFKKHPRIG